MYFPVEGWFAAFALTFAVEAPIIALLLRGNGVTPARAIALALFANLATHPIVWFVIPQLLDIGTPEYTAVAEGWAVLAETALYWLAVSGLTVRRALVIALVANAASWAAGHLVAAAIPSVFG
jgi:hypothetical protein